MRSTITAQIIFVALVLMLASACASNPQQQEEPAGQEAIAERTHPAPRTESIATVHRENRAEIRGCFEQVDTSEGANQAGQLEQPDQAGQPGQPDQPGQINQAEVELRLPASGAPASIRLLEPERLPPTLVSCLENALIDLDYGEGQSGATFYQELTYDRDAGQLEFGEPVDAYERWGLTGDEIDEVVHAEEDQIEQCYELADGSPAGRVIISLAIGSDGSVTRAGLESSSLDAPPVENCVAEILFELDFPEPRGGGVVVVDYPFRFNPNDGWVRQGVPGL